MIKVRLIHKKNGYCIAKPASWMAVFVSEPKMNHHTKTPYDIYCTVQNQTAKDCQVGKWYCLAYESKKESGQNVVLREVVL